MLREFPFPPYYSHMMQPINHLRYLFFRLGGPRGPFQPKRPHSKGPKRFFKRGQLKFALLELLDQESMHGYQMIKALEEKTNGFYSPSPGSIYPTLQLLEDQEYVVSKKIAGKNLYQITTAGRQYLKENQTENSFFQTEDCQELHHALRAEANELTHLIGHAFRGAIQDPKQLNELLHFMKKVNKGLSTLLDAKQEE